MKIKNKVNIIAENVEVIDAGAEGKAVCFYNERVLFVPYAVPGDIIDVKIIKKQKRYYEGLILNIKEYSHMRVQSFCKHFTLCGGCKWQNMGYKQQLFFKQKQVIDAFERIGNLKDFKINNIIPSENTIKYRNKLEFTFSNLRWLTNDEMAFDNQLDTRGLGFHIPGKFDRVLDIDTCYLQSEPTNIIRKELKLFAIGNNLLFYNIRNHTGELRNLIIRNSSTSNLMVIVVFATESNDIIKSVMDFLKNKFNEITSLYYVINTKKNDSIADLEPILWNGEKFIIENLNKLNFQIGPLSFFQTNTLQAKNLYDIALKFASCNKSEVVYDLYTGCGTIAAYISEYCKKVVGIEYIESAVEDARTNSLINNIKNTTFFAGDIAKILTQEFININGNPDVIITDPPRAGMHPIVIKQLLLIKAKRIVYISCNPATQARDINMLSEAYKTIEIQPVDMFPHTHHVENVALLILKE